MEDHITSEKDLLEIHLPNIRLWYTTSISSDNPYQSSKGRNLMRITDEVSGTHLPICLLFIRLHVLQLQ